MSSEERKNKIVITDMDETLETKKGERDDVYEKEFQVGIKNYIIHNLIRLF